METIYLAIFCGKRVLELAEDLEVSITLIVCFVCVHNGHSGTSPRGD